MGSEQPTGVEFDTIRDEFGKLSTGIEEKIFNVRQADALESVRKDFPKYFDALDKHPRLLVGTEVPAIGKEGTEVLRDSNDAKDWQEAIKAALIAEIRSRTDRAMEDDREIMSVVHDSIELFQNNPDLVPGTKQFDRELADRFVALAKPYELRVEGKLHGYSIPVQPLVTQVRSDLVASRAKAAQPQPPAAGAPQGAGAPAAPAAAPTPPPPAPAPQGGIPSKAGASADDKDDFSVLFGTLGMPGLRI